MMLKKRPTLLQIKDKHGQTPLHSAARAKRPDVVEKMYELAGEVILRMLQSFDQIKSLLATEGFVKALPLLRHMVVKAMKQSEESPCLAPLRLCMDLRRAIEARQRDSYTNDIADMADWLEAFAATACADMSEWEFMQSLENHERVFFKYLDEAEALQVVTQPNSIRLVKDWWRKSYVWVDLGYKRHSVKNRLFLSPRIAFMSRLTAMIVLIVFVLLHAETVKRSNDERGGTDLWVWGIVIMGFGFLAQDIMQMVRLSKVYWSEYWRYMELVSSLATFLFVVSHFVDDSSDLTVSSLSLVGLLFALRLLQIATLSSSTGPLILSVVKIFSDISMFLLLFAYVLLTVAATLVTLSSHENYEHFGSYGRAILSLFYAVLGSFQEPLDNSIDNEFVLTASLLCLFLILAPIILLSVLVAIMASTWGSIAQYQNAQYQLIRIRILNEYLLMPSYERLPPPFSILAVLVLAPLRHLAWRIGAIVREQPISDAKQNRASVFTATPASRPHRQTKSSRPSSRFRHSVTRMLNRVSIFDISFRTDARTRWRSTLMQPMRRHMRLTGYSWLSMSYWAIFIATLMIETLMYSVAMTPLLVVAAMWETLVGLLPVGKHRLVDWRDLLLFPYLPFLAPVLIFYSVLEEQRKAQVERDRDMDAKREREAEEAKEKTRMTFNLVATKDLALIGTPRPSKWARYIDNWSETVDARKAETQDVMAAFNKLSASFSSFKDDVTALLHRIDARQVESEARQMQIEQQLLKNGQDGNPVS